MGIAHHTFVETPTPRPSQKKQNRAVAINSEKPIPEKFKYARTAVV